MSISKPSFDKEVKPGRTRRSARRFTLNWGMIMRFTIMVKADKNSDAGILPDEKLLTEMGKYNEDLAKAGVLLAAEGLQPSSRALGSSSPETSALL
jgi:hypothetical protein